MALEAALAVATGLTQLSSLAAHTADNIADKWYEASEDLEEFQELEDQLKRKIDIWKEALRNAGLSDERCITEPLKDAIECLEGEKIKIDSVQSNCCLFRFMFWFKAQPFPAHLKRSMKKVVDALDNLPNVFGQRSEPARMLELIADGLPDAYQIFVDKRIVGLSQTQDEVMHHLQDKTGDQVVTLHGGAGSGKTSLAKSLARHYLTNREFFADGARFMSCGHNATAESICKNLFQSLGISDDSAPDTKVEQSSKAKGTPLEGQSPSLPSCLKKLPRRLKERHLLIVLDDVSDHEILKEKLIVPSAKHVKYLITSKQRDIYDGATMVHMNPPTDEEAMQVLCNYIPNFKFKGKIPQHLQEKGNQIIQKADRNPMMLATIGRQIDDFDDETSWDEVLTNFNDLLLSNKHTSGDKMTMSIRMEIDALKSLNSSFDTQKLLCLMALCEPLNVPEVVLQLLFQHIEPSHCSSFKNHMKTLKDRDLISFQGKHWILSSTYQYFILKNKKELVSELICSLMKEGNDDGNNELVRALCVLYIISKDDDYTREATIALKEVSLKFNTSFEKKNIIWDIREAIKPLIYLLLSSKEGTESQIRRHHLASEAIKQFVSKQDLDDESFARLLDEKDIYEDICGVLQRMASVPRDPRNPILSKDTKLTLEELMFNLTPTSEDIVTTLDTLSALSHEANCDFILEDDHILKNLLEILQSGDHGTKQSVLECVRDLAQSSTAKLKMVSCEGLIEALVAIFYMDSDIMVQDNILVKVCSIQTLGQIGFQEKTSSILMETPNLLASIAQFLEDIYFKDKEREFILELGHYAAISTIQSLAYLVQGNDDNEDYIKKHEDLIHILTRIFETYNGDNSCFGDCPQDYNMGDDVAAATLFVLTVINPTKYNNNKVILYSKDTYIQRGNANVFCRLYEEAFHDFKRADQKDDSNDLFYKTNLCFLKAMLKDYQGALRYAKWAIEDKSDYGYVWQEIGVLKELMEDYEGSKDYLNKALGLSPNDYEVLKHRAYVNFKLGCIEEAHEDAKKALQVIPNYTPDYGRYGCLGTLSVPKFLDYNLR